MKQKNICTRGHNLYWQFLGIKKKEIWFKQWIASNIQFSLTENVFVSEYDTNSKIVDFEESQHPLRHVQHAVGF